MYEAKQKRLAAIFALWVVIILSSSVARAQPGEAATLTLPNMPLHDPWMLANDSDKTYYLYTSNMPRMSGVQGPGTMVYRSKDLKHWEKPVARLLYVGDAVGAEGGVGSRSASLEGQILLVYDGA